MYSNQESFPSHCRYKIEFTEARNKEIDHHSVVIRTSLEWPKTGVDKPTFIIDVYDKNVQSLDHVNINHQHQHDNLSAYVSPVSNSHFDVSNNFNDILQQITSLKNDLPSQKQFPGQVPNNPCLYSPTNLNFPPHQINLQIAASSPINEQYPIQTDCQGPKQRRSINSPPSKPLICCCPNPTQNHNATCPTLQIINTPIGTSPSNSKINRSPTNYIVNQSLQQPLNMSQSLPANPIYHQFDTPMPSIERQYVQFPHSHEQIQMVHNQNLINLPDQNNKSNKPVQIPKKPVFNSSSLLSKSFQLQQPYVLDDCSTLVQNDPVIDTRQNSIVQENLSLSDKKVRSPVQLDVNISGNLSKDNGIVELDEVIETVVNGGGTISIEHASLQSSKHQRKKKSLSTLIVTENDMSIPSTTTYLSSPSNSNVNHSTFNNPAVVTLTSHIIHPPDEESATTKQLITEQSPTKTNKKRPRSKSNSNNSFGNTPRASPLQESSLSSPLKMISPITPASTYNNETNPQSNHSAASSTSKTVTNTIEPFTTELSNNFIQYSTMKSWPPPGTDFVLSTDNDFLEHDELEQICSDDQVADLLDSQFPSDQYPQFYNSLTPPPPAPFCPIMTNEIFQSKLTANVTNSSTTSISNNDAVYNRILGTTSSSSTDFEQDNQITTYALTPPDIHDNILPQQKPHSDVNRNLISDQHPQQISPSKKHQINSNKSDSMTKMTDAQALSSSSTLKQKQAKKKIKINNDKTLSKIPIKPCQKSKNQSQPSSKCTRCGSTSSVDITKHEFSKQTGLIFECISCGNNSMQSNVSANERKRRLNQVANDHLNNIICHFCQKIFYSHSDYLTHLKVDHESIKPI